MAADLSFRVRTWAWGAFCALLFGACVPLVFGDGGVMDRLAGLTGMLYAGVLFGRRCVRKKCCEWKPKPKG